MYGFPTILHPDHDEVPQGLFFDDNIMFGFPEGRSIFYSRKDGNWNDPSTWSTVGNGGRFGLPTANDPVYIRHNVSVNINNAVCWKMFVSGVLLFDPNVSGPNISVYGDINSVGSIDMTSLRAPKLTIYGSNNKIANFNGATSGTFVYAGVNQPILNLPYRHLTLSNAGAKYTATNISILGNLLIDSKASLELYNFDLTVNGTTQITGYGTLSKAGAGSLLFVGLLDISINAYGYLYLSGGNPSVELRGGFAVWAFGKLETGTGTWSFTTNNQSFSRGGAGSSFDCPIIIDNITLANSGIYNFKNSINGTSSTSKFLNNGTTNLYSTTLPMLTGIFDIATYANTVGYYMESNYTLPYTTYSSLTIGGSFNFIKSISANTTLTGGLAVNSLFELSTYDLTVTGTTNIGNGNIINPYTLSKTGSGIIIFIGQVVFGNYYTGMNLVGNPNLELRGGIDLAAGVLLGIPTLIFTTNNQAITAFRNCNLGAANILVSGAITVTATITNTTVTISGTLNGNNAGSVFDNRAIGTGALAYNNASKPMITGSLVTNGGANTFNYNAAGDQDIKGGTYNNLTLSGSGVKKLTGNVVVTGTYTLSGTATIDLNGYTLT